VEIPGQFLAGFGVARLEGLLVSGREILAPPAAEIRLVPAPPWLDGPLHVVRVVGDAGLPFYGDGDHLYYPPADGPPADALIGWECVCRLCDGRTLLRTLQRGSRSGLWRLDSPTTTPLLDVELESASPVLWTTRTPRRAGSPPRRPDGRAAGPAAFTPTKRSLPPAIVRRPHRTGGMMRFPH
jgi:hypothetical protein